MFGYTSTNVDFALFHDRRAVLNFYEKAFIEDDIMQMAEMVGKACLCEDFEQFVASNIVRYPDRKEDGKSLERWEKIRYPTEPIAFFMMGKIVPKDVYENLMGGKTDDLLYKAFRELDTIDQRLSEAIKRWNSQKEIQIGTGLDSTASDVEVFDLMKCLHSVDVRACAATLGLFSAQGVRQNVSDVEPGKMVSGDLYYWPYCQPLLNHRKVGQDSMIYDDDNTNTIVYNLFKNANHLMALSSVSVVPYSIKKMKMMKQYDEYLPIDSMSEGDFDDGSTFLGRPVATECSVKNILTAINSIVVSFT